MLKTLNSVAYECYYFKRFNDETIFFRMYSIKFMYVPTDID